MKSAIKQMKGPGMNLGLKKPRKNYIPKPKPYKPSKAMKAASKTDSSSYLPNFSGGGSVPAYNKGGKVISCKYN